MARVLFCEIGTVKSLYPVTKALVLKPWHRKLSKQGKPRNRFYLTPETKLVLEGFPSSANSSAAKAIRQANGLMDDSENEFAMVTHVHSSNVIIKAMEAGLPTIVIIRPPLDVVSSMIRRWPQQSAKYNLRWYKKFYTSLLPYKGKFVVSDFKQTISTFPEVVMEANELFGTDLAIPEDAHKQWDRGAKFAKMTEEEIASEKSKGLEIRQKIESDCKSELAQAVEVYQKIISN